MIFPRAIKSLPSVGSSFPGLFRITGMKHSHTVAQTGLGVVFLEDHSRRDYSQILLAPIFFIPFDKSG